MNKLIIQNLRLVFVFILAFLCVLALCIALFTDTHGDPTALIGTTGVLIGYLAGRRESAEREAEATAPPRPARKLLLPDDPPAEESRAVTFPTGPV